ncbi:MAG: hypothetical protein QW453_00660 [Thermoprotei archaeon]
MDPVDVRTLFGDPASLESGKLQFFALQYYLYLGLLQGLLVYPACLVSMLLSTPIAIVALANLKRSTSLGRGYS